MKSIVNSQIYVRKSCSRNEEAKESMWHYSMRNKIARLP